MDVLSRAVMCFCLMGWMTLGWSNAAQYTSINMKSNIDKLKVHYKISKDQLFNGNPVFPTRTHFKSTGRSPSFSPSGHIFSQMLNQTGNRDQEMIEKTLFPGEDTWLRTHLQNLWAIETSDTTVQGKALSEFITIYEKASKLALKFHLKKDNRRKRRQAQRLKSHIM
uniref:Uncharacterized protein n=1 Tax=Oncorhynchus tshawytscha TaxID=74940 RepID=A0AAZ3PW74_ONCTS